MKTGHLRRYLFVLSGLILAATYSVSYAEQQTSKYLSVSDKWAFEQIEAPPPLDSEFYRSQLETVLWLQVSRTPDQVWFVSQPLTPNFFAGILDKELFNVDGRELLGLLDQVSYEAKEIYDVVKAHYDRPRPFVVSDKVKPAAHARPVASYPSGHAIRATIYAGVFSEVFPCKREELTDLAKRIGYGRVIGGAHFPIDVEAGFKLGNAFVEQLANSSEFQQALDDIGKANACQDETE